MLSTGALWSIGIVLLILVALEITRSADGRGPLESATVGLPAHTPIARGETVALSVWNIHSGRNAEKRYTFDDMPGVVAHADIVALQEVGGAGWGQPPNQARQIAERLQDRQWFFAPTRQRWFRPRGGNGLVSRFPLQNAAAVSLDSAHRDYRNYIQAALPVVGGEVQIFVAHVTTREKRLEQLGVMIDAFLAAPRGLLLGDLNTRRDDPALKRLFNAPGVVEAITHAEQESGRELRIASDVDWIFARGLSVIDARVERNALSDHPVWHATLRVD